MFRNIVEISVMINNDEEVFYTEDEQLSYEEKRSPFSDPKLMLSRPIFDLEIEQGLDTTYKGKKFNEKSPEITKFLDAYFIIKQVASSDLSPSKIIAFHIGTNFYDAMSGGLPGHELAILRHVILNHEEVNLQEEVYPRHGEKEPWYTIADFLEETKDFDMSFLEKAIKQLGVTLQLEFKGE